jgi:hypothetical protein
MPARDFRLLTSTVSQVLWHRNSDGLVLRASVASVARPALAIIDLLLGRFLSRGIGSVARSTHLTAPLARRTLASSRSCDSWTRPGSPDAQALQHCSALGVLRHGRNARCQLQSSRLASRVAAGGCRVYADEPVGELAADVLPGSCLATSCGRRGTSCGRRGAADHAVHWVGRDASATPGRLYVAVSDQCFKGDHS